MRAIIMAGGKGTRLRPYTTLIPKPLVPLGNELPILEVILRQLKKAGFTHITITVNHLAELIRAFFGQGERWDLRIDYSMEDEPLSTIGPLTLIPDLPENFLVMNGDVLCDLDYRGFFRHHVEHGHDVTVSTCKRDNPIDYGVLRYTDDNRICHFEEKPTYHFDVSMGVYCLKRSVLEKIPRGTFYGLNHLLLDGLAQGRPYFVKPFSGFWLDIGRPEDYDYCNEHFEEIRKLIGLE